MKGGERHPVGLPAFVGEQRPGLELVGFGEPAVLGEGSLRFPLVPSSENLGQRRPGGTVFRGLGFDNEIADLGQRRPQPPQAHRSGDLGGPGAVLDEARDHVTVGDARPNRLRPALPHPEPRSLQLTEPAQGHAEQRSEQDSADGEVAFGGRLGGRNHHVEGEANRRLVDEAGVGPVMGYAAALQGAGEGSEEATLGAGEHGHAAMRDPLFEVEALDLGRDPLRFLDLLVEPVDLDRALPGSGNHLAGSPGELVGGHPHRSVQDLGRDPV